MVVAMPAWYGRTDHPPLPLVISPHGRGATALGNARRWGQIPGRFGLLVLNPSLHGRVFARRSWAWPPEIAELARLPRIAVHLIPYLRYDPNRVYALGSSMGGQEALMLLARHPDMLAAVVAADPVTNFRRRWYQYPRSANSRNEQQAATREVGSRPARAPWLYIRRSPRFFVRTIAFARVPTQLWWNPADTVVVKEGTTQAGAFYQAVRRLDPRAPIYVRNHRYEHGWVFKYDHDLPAMVRFLLRFHRHGPPVSGFAYVSWLPRATVWGWQVRAPRTGHGLWQLATATAQGFHAVSNGRLLVRPPFPVTDVRLDGQRISTRNGAIPVPAGAHRVLFATG